MITEFPLLAGGFKIFGHAFATQSVGAPNAAGGAHAKQCPGSGRNSVKQGT